MDNSFIFDGMKDEQDMISKGMTHNTILRKFKLAALCLHCVKFYNDTLNSF